jgi:hypothetical protein
MGTFTESVAGSGVTLPGAFVARTLIKDAKAIARIVLHED